jgi:hypothetical protein
VKYMILTYASQQDYDALAGKPEGGSAWSAEDFAAMGAFMASFIQDLVASNELVETYGLLPTGRPQSLTTPSSCSSCAAIPRSHPHRKLR